MAPRMHFQPLAFTTRLFASFTRMFLLKPPAVATLVRENTDFVESTFKMAEREWTGAVSKVRQRLECGMTENPAGF
jgi:hypothetical protein